MHCIIFRWAWTHSSSCDGDNWMLPELYLSGLQPLLIFCPSCEVLNSTYRLSHIQNTLQGFCVGLSFMQHYIFQFPHASTLRHCLHHLLYWNTETFVKPKYSILLSSIKYMQWLSWCWLIEMSNGTNFDEEDVNCQSNPVVRSYLWF